MNMNWLLREQPLTNLLQQLQKHFNLYKYQFNPIKPRLHLINDNRMWVTESYQSLNPFILIYTHLHQFTPIYINLYISTYIYIYIHTYRFNQIETIYLKEIKSLNQQSLASAWNWMSWRYLLSHFNESIIHWMIALHCIHHYHGYSQSTLREQLEKE